jgi:hypothetical protein
MNAACGLIAGVFIGAAGTTLFQAAQYMPGTIATLTAFWLLLMAGHVGTFVLFCDRRDMQ